MLDSKKWEDLLKRAKAGDAIAQAEVGNFYQNGYIDSNKETIVRRNYKLSHKWYEKSAEQNNVEAVSGLAYLTDSGLGCVKDVIQAILLYKKAISLGSYLSAYNLGMVYRDLGKYKMAFKFYVLAMTMQKSSYSLIVGLCYYFGIGVKQDKMVAIKHFKAVSIDKLETHDFIEQECANFYLGISYLTGEGVKKSLRNANRYFDLAINSNNNVALEMTFLIGKKSK